MFRITSAYKLSVILLALVVSTAFGPYCLAQETRYVSDVLYVPLRSGAGNQFRIINAALRSATPLTLIEENEDASWAKVTTPNGTEGWIPTQYIMSDRPSQLQLSEALTKVAQLEKNNAAITQKNQQLAQENNTLQNLATSQSAERDSMATELQNIKQISREAILLKESNTELLEKNQLLQTQRDTLIAENDILKADQRMDFFLYGAGLILLGVILTLIIPALAPKKGYSEWRS